ncbi:MAG: 2,3-bisphosphoglycerate-independent phosphoglycerate mutase [Dehalococcoidia bacterium]|nr:2,3-bisphosphoglycerate-independent phosphoglycerate mutase [Dehalococcoidia bacterium]
MANLKLMQQLSVQTPSKIVFFVIDGLGGLPGPEGLSELEMARTPNLDHLAAESVCGLIQHVAPGITPGSGPGHLALFGYDPLEFDIGRGILEALGLDMEVRGGDMAARGNFCTVDSDNVLLSRRGGRSVGDRLETEENPRLVEVLKTIDLPGASFEIRGGREHRFAVVFRAPGLSDALTDTDPQHEGLAPRPAQAMDEESQSSADLVNKFIALAREKLEERYHANMIMLRGFSKQPPIPAFPKVYNLHPGAIAIYPMYRGLAKLLGMEIVPTGATAQDTVITLKEQYDNHDFFFLHFKRADAAGEDGDFPAKVQALEEADSLIPSLMELNPDVLVVTGDHSTPAVLAAHSWHPVPVAMRAKWLRPDDVCKFSEKAFRDGSLGRFQATDLMPLAMAHALKLAKYGA